MPKCAFCGTLTNIHTSFLCQVGEHALPGDLRFKILNMAGPAGAQKVASAAAQQTQLETHRAATEARLTDFRRTFGQTEFGGIPDFLDEVETTKASAGGPAATALIGQLDADMDPVVQLYKLWSKAHRRLKEFYRIQVREIPSRLKKGEDLNAEMLKEEAKRKGDVLTFIEAIEGPGVKLGWQRKARKHLEDVLKDAAGYRAEVELALKERFKFKDDSIASPNDRAILNCLKDTSNNKISGALRLAAQQGRVKVTAALHDSPTDPQRHVTVMIVDAAGKKVGNQWHVYAKKDSKDLAITGTQTI